MAFSGSCADMPSGDVDTELENIDSTSEALTCITIRRGGLGNIEDGHIVADPTDPSKANTNYGIATQLNAGQVGTGLRRAILQVDLSPIPAGAVITSATLDLQKSNGIGTGNVDVHRITTPWSESTVTYNTINNSWDPSITASFDPTTVANGGPVSIDLTSLVNSWVSGALPNDGIVLEQPSTGRTYFGSSESAVLNPRPRLAVCYAPASCADGVQNGAETGVDCGGPCAPCNACAGVVCSPLDQCHVAGVCNPSTGLCSNPAATNHTPCDDSNACTQTDSCLGGNCVGSNPITCSASDQCHSAGLCDPQSGACSNPSVADGTSCDDGDACTQSDTCQAGVCTGATSVVCNATDACHSPGTCDPVTGTCSNPTAADGTVCDDGDACTQTDTCTAGACGGANPVSCGASDACHVAGSCDPTTGACSNPTAADGTACDDGDACTQTDTCQAGVCTGSNPINCAASDQCHNPGTCDSATGACSNPSVADGATCDDGDSCTQGDTCEQGVCGGSATPSALLTGAAEVPGPGDPDGSGTVDLTLDENAGTICFNIAWANILAPISMHIHNAPAGQSAGVFVSLGVPANSGCVNTTGANIALIRANPQNFYVNVHTSDFTGGAIRGQLDKLLTCPASDQCHGAGTCDSATGACSDPAATDGSSCDDGDACTQVDTCQAGVCSGGSPVTCAASDQCHSTGTCDPTTGVCSNPSVADGTSCDDGDACTQTDTCQAGVCSGSNPVTCAASDQCHSAGTCDSATGACSNPSVADGTSCDDGDACTQTDTCQAGACTGSNPVTCAASDQCHSAGTCDSATGACSNPSLADGTGCDDGDACTRTDTCQAGSCLGGNLTVCTASDQCHAAGTCDPTSGVCSDPAVADGTSCDDADACTQTDTCQAGACSGGNPVVCAASDQCHAAGTCDSATGSCSNPSAADGTACDDGNVCTQTDTCQAGTCSGSNPVSGACSTGLLGVCSAGTLSCAANVITCNQTTFPSTEACDGLDNDCDGVVDDDTDPNDSNSCGSPVAYSIAPGGQVDVFGTVDASGDDYIRFNFTSVPAAGFYYHPVIELLDSAGGAYILSIEKTCGAGQECGQTLSKFEMLYPNDPNGCQASGTCTDATPKPTSWVVRVLPTASFPVCSNYQVRASNI